MAAVFSLLCIVVVRMSLVILCLCCRHGLFRSDQLIYGDPELSFGETVPQTALFDPTANQGEIIISARSDSPEATNKT